MIENVLKRLRIRIREFLELTQTTQRKFAAQLGITETYLSMFLREQRNIDLEYVEKACRIIGIDPQEVWQDKQSKPLELLQGEKDLEKLYWRNRAAFKLTVDNVTAWLNAPPAKEDSTEMTARQ